MLIPEFTAPSYRDRDINAIQRCVNMSPEKGAHGYALVKMPGLSLLGTATNNLAGKGLYMTGQYRLFSVHGTILYEFDSSGTPTNRGTLSGLDDFVEMVDNGTQLMIRGNTKGWIFTFASNALAQIVDANYPSVTRGLVFKDSYFIVTSYPTGRFYLSALLDGTAWTPATYATAENSSDDLGGIAVAGNNLYLVGAKTTEPWYNTGNASFTFERIQGGALDVGTYYPWSISTLHNSIYLVAESQGKQAAWAIGPGGSKKISTPYIDSKLLGLNPLRGLSYSENGADYYVLTAYGATPTQTWVYNITEDAWCERTSNRSSAYVAWIVSAMVPGFAGVSQILCSSYDDGSIYTLNRTTNSDNGTAIQCIRDFGPVGDNMTYLFHKRLRFALEIKHDSSASYTLSSLVQWSDDNGLTFNTGVTVTKAITTGTTGQSVNLDAWRLGRSRQRYYRITFTGPAAQLILNGVDLIAEKGLY